MWDGYDLSLMVHSATLFDFVVNLKGSESRIHSWISSLWGLTFANKGGGFKLKYCNVRYSAVQTVVNHIFQQKLHVFSAQKEGFVKQLADWSWIQFVIWERENQVICV